MSGSAPAPRDRTIVQEGQGWNARYDVRTDAVLVYGVDATLEERVRSWRERGYIVHLMTGLAWGHYQDYLLGHWDGREHWDEAQRRANGEPILHGPDMPYMIPTSSYTDYLASLLVQAIEAGVEAIFLEEPEYWAYAGYGTLFDRDRARDLGIPYRDPASDPAAFAADAARKYHLFGDVIYCLCAAVHYHSASRPGGPIPCYVATHSLLNYAHNRIVSPLAYLPEIPHCGGAVVQVWSHTARSQVMYEGTRAEHMFPVAFLEYASGLELARGTDRRLWFLADPVEDSPTYGWDRYRAGYQVTVAASLFFPQVNSFEVMPWPSRVFTGRYPRRPEGPPGDPIPAAYASELLAVTNALRAMPDSPARWDCGTQGIGVLMADSLMFRRMGPLWDDPELSAFYGLALPPLMAGMPVRPVSLEVMARHGVPDDIHTLLLSYDGMTPPDALAHEALVGWVRQGNALLLFGAGDGPYETLPAWWNDGQGGIGPWPHLHCLLGISGLPGLHTVGAGLVAVEPDGPITLARATTGAGRVRAVVRGALEALDAAPEYIEQHHMILRRGHYVLAAVLDWQHAAPSLRLEGSFVDMFDGDLSIRHGVDLAAGQVAFLLDIADAPAAPCVLATSGRLSEELAGDRTLRFTLHGPINTFAVCRLRLPAAPLRAAANDSPLAFDWDAASGTARLRHPNEMAGVNYVVEW